MLGGQEFLATVRRLSADAARARSRTSGRSSPSRTTCPTGGRVSRRASPTGGASHRARAGSSRRTEPSELRPHVRQPRRIAAHPRRRRRCERIAFQLRPSTSRRRSSSPRSTDGAHAGDAHGRRTVVRRSGARVPKDALRSSTTSSSRRPSRRPTAVAATLKSREPTGPEVRLRHRGRRVGTGEGNRRRIARPAAQGARAAGAAPEVRSVPERRPGDDEPVPARRGLRHRGRRRDRPRHRPLRALRRRELPRAMRATAQARSGTPSCARSARASSSARPCR